MFRTARWRLVAWNVLVFGVFMFVIEVGAYAVFKSRIYSGVDSELKQQEGHVMAQLPEFWNYSPFVFFTYRYTIFPAEYRTLVATTTGHVSETSSCPNPAAYPVVACLGTMQALSSDGLSDIVKRIKSEPAETTRHDPVLSTEEDVRNSPIRGQPWRVLTFAVLSEGRALGIFQIARTVSGEASALNELRVLLLFGGIFSVFLATVGSLFLADRALVPIREAFTRQRQFTADASHELRTPLALIRANAEMLYRHIHEGDGELVGEIIRETDHLNRLVGDLLTLARADTGTLKLTAREVDFRELVEEVHADLHVIAESRGIGTTLSLNGPVMVNGDEGRLRQLLLILLDNALKYTDPGGRVDVSVLREDNRARLIVADTGVGIPAKDLPHIFDRFYRVDRAREHESGGTGLGLAIARWIVQAHHGSIKVESESGQGSRFQVDLPVQ